MLQVEKLSPPISCLNAFTILLQKAAMVKPSLLGTTYILGLECVVRKYGSKNTDLT